MKVLTDRNHPDDDFLVKERMSHMKALRGMLAMSIIIMLAAVSAIAETQKPTALTEEQKLKSCQETLNGIVSTENGTEFFCYAQNTPEWKDIHVGKEDNRYIKGSACALFSLANIIINTVPAEELNKLESLAKNPIKIDTKSVTFGRGVAERESFEIKGEPDYFRFYPLALANVITGNNWGMGISYNNNSYYADVLDAYGLTYRKAKFNEEAEAIKAGEHVICSVCTGGNSSPIAPSFGHFMVLCGYEDGKYYFLDSIKRDNYEYDKKGLIHVVVPGLICVEEADVEKLSMNGTGYIVAIDERHAPMTSARMEELANKSNEMIGE